MTDIYRVDLASGEVEEATPEQEARLREVAAVDRIVAGFAGTDDRHDAVELSEDRTPEETPTGSYFGTDEFLRMAQQPDAPPTEDAELHEALRAQAEADGFGDDSPDVSDSATDEELWDAFASTWGIEEEGQR